jgi:glycosyltransferase involved in cell wall biosynthesis
MPEILIINHYASLGSGRHSQLAREMVRRGYGVTIAAASFQHKTSAQRTGVVVSEGINYIFVPTCSYRGNGPGRVTNMLQFTARVKGCLPKGYKPDIVIGSSVHPFAWLAAESIARKAGAPFIAEVRDLWPQTLIDMGVIGEKSIQSWFFCRLEKRAYKKSKHIISLAPAGDIYICKRYGTNPDKITHISNGVDIKEFDCFAQENAGKAAEILKPYNNKYIVAYAGAMGKPNQMDTIIGAAREIAAEGADRVCFLLFGQGTEVERLKSEIADMGLDNVHFMGQQPYSLIPALLRGCHLNIVAMKNIDLYQYGISLNKLYVYLASGNPIVFSGKASNDLVRDAGAGISVEPEDSKATAKAILKIMADQAMAQEMGRRGRRLAEESYDIPILTNKLENVIARCLGNEIN